MRYFTFFFFSHTESLKSGEDFTFTAHLNRSDHSQVLDGHRWLVAAIVEGAGPEGFGFWVTSISPCL